jgi:hypothetical protein
MNKHFDGNFMEELAGVGELGSIGFVGVDDTVTVEQLSHMVWSMIFSFKMFYCQGLALLSLGQHSAHVDDADDFKAVI